MKISVCIATFNGQHFIKEQLQSILCQIGERDEVIISDDHSSDHTIELIKQFKDNRIQIFSNDKASGYSSNFENAISKSSGDIIFISDQDDVWIEHKVEKMVKELESCYLVVSDAEIVDENLTQIAMSHFHLNKTRGGFFINFVKTRYIGACMAFRREILTKALPFPKNYYLSAYDYWIALIAEMYYSVHLLREPLLKYRRHGKNASTGGSGKSPNSVGKILSTRLYVLKELMIRGVKS